MADETPVLANDPAAAIELGIGDPTGFRYRCLRFPFDATVLEQPGADEEAMSREAAALRKYLATPPAKADGLPESGWHLLGNDGKFAEFVSKGVLGGEVVVHEAWVEDGWRVSAQGAGCRPELVLPVGVGRGSWELDPDGPQPGPQARVLRLLVEEWTCASGQPPLGRIVGPVVLPEGDRVFIFFGVRPLPGAATCQRSPPSKVEIDLGEAIGERVLVDPFVWPQVVVDVS